MATDKTRWKVFGAWLKAQRENAKLSQEGLGDRIEVDRQTIYRIENGLSGTKRETVIALAKALQVSESEALIKAGFSPQNSETDTYKILDGVMISFQDDDLSKKQQQEIADIVRKLVVGVKAEKQNQ
ncbi:MAG: helix-turn-helix domain-containing protein [Pyrinomonadaceae bacterium]|nr:helix-turn-helix domain-containing protein [Pyrinomonadaceae bacterium]